MHLLRRKLCKDIDGVEPIQVQPHLHMSTVYTHVRQTHLNHEARHRVEAALVEPLTRGSRSEATER